MEKHEIIDMLKLMTVTRDKEHDIWFNGEYLGTIMVYNEDGYRFYRAEHEMTSTYERHISYGAALESYVDFAYEHLDAAPQNLVLLSVPTEQPEKTILSVIKGFLGVK